METTYKLLDHGYLRLIETWGSDERIIEAARMSTDKGFLGWGPNWKCRACGCLWRENPGENSVSLLNDVQKSCRECEYGSTEIVCDRTPGDEKLLRYLYEHKHATPFEMAGLVIEVMAPIFVFREWHRHRTQCLAPDTLVHFDAPKSREHRRFVYKMRIEDIWRKWQPTSRSTRPERQTNALFSRDRIQGMRLRNLNEEAREFRHSRILDVIRGEPKEMVRVTTASGRSVGLSRDHRVLTSVGWMCLGDALKQGALLTLEGTTRAKAERWDVPAPDPHTEVWRPVVGWENLYAVSNEGRIRRLGSEPKKPTEGANGYSVVSLSRQGRTITRTVHTLVLEAFRGLRPEGYEARHLNSNRADARLANLVWGSPAENARDRIDADRQQRLVPVFEEIVEVTTLGKVPTFDLSVEGPWHNFVADGFVVHNSYNEMSARYTPLPDLNYIPTVERLMMNSTTNKQAGRIAGAADLTVQNAEWFRESLAIEYACAEALYQEALARGVPKELARIHLPLARYSKMRASANLRNWLAFLTLRSAPAAQWEIREYSHTIEKIIAQKFARTSELFQEKRTA